MRVWKEFLLQGLSLHRSGILLLTLGLLGVALPAAAQQVATPADHERTKVEEIPDSPGAVLAKWQAPAQSQSAPNPLPAAQQPSSQPLDTLQSTPQKPVGTAAAEAPNASGVAASQPAGVAIAPAKQRRVRTIVIRVGAIIGAAAAVGAVVALTEATSSRPPGAH